MEVIEETRFIKSSVSNNNNKFWYIYRYDNNSCRTEFGRVGGKGDGKDFPFSSEDQAIKFFEKKCREKEKKGYKKLNVIANNTVTTVKSNPSTDLSEIAKKQIKTNSPDTTNLIAYLSKANIHNILTATTMTYNVDSGLFSTPCGIVTQDALDTARDLLTKMAPFVVKNKLTDKKYIEYLEDYLMLVPQKVGRKLDSTTLYTKTEDIQSQNTIIDSLEVSLKNVLKNPTTDNSIQIDQPKLFSVELNIIDDNIVLKRLKNKFHDTLDRNHACSHLDIKKAYTVDLESMTKAFEEKGKPLGNIRELWHGTRVHNILSILKSGLQIPRSGASHVTGRLFGDGVYAASSSTKSLNYSYGFWDNKGSDNNCFMFLCDVALGKYYHPKGTYESFPKPGYDSTWARSNETGLRHDEFIVYELPQVNLKYLIEFSPEGK